MQEVDKCLLNFILVSFGEMLEAMKSVTIDNLIALVPSRKSDSLGLDVFPENAIRRKLIDNYDKDIVLITEEIGSYNMSNIGDSSIVAISDPTDRSKILKDFIEEKFSQNSITPESYFGELLDTPDLCAEWERYTKNPVLVSGACSAISILKKGQILFTAILNYLAQTVIVACEDFIGYAPISNAICDKSAWCKIDFAGTGDPKSFVTFLAKDYQYYLNTCGMFGKPFIPMEQEPGGPARILFLSDIHENPVGYILSNGEKIGEWIHWLAFCKFRPDLVAYSIHPETFLSNEEKLMTPVFIAKDGILMTPSPHYSILESDRQNLLINYKKLSYMMNPSRYREMILVSHINNGFIQDRVEIGKFRRLLRRF